MIEITNKLSGCERQSGTHAKVWDHRSIGYILQNERYVGDVLWQKRYTVDTLPLQVKPNRGERARYYVSEHHAPIITREMFDAVQSLVKRRQINPCKAKRLVKHILASMLVCSECRTTFRKKVSNSKVYWGCERKDKQKSQCKTAIVAEQDIYSTYIIMHNRMSRNKDMLLIPLLHTLEKIRQLRDYENPQVIALDTQIHEILEQHQMLSGLRSKGIMNAALCISQQHELNQKAERLRQEKRSLTQYDATDDAILRTQELIDTLENGVPYMTTFDEETFKATVRQIVVQPNDRIVFRLHNGLEFAEQLERRR